MDKSRDKIIVRTSIIGIAANVFLSILKLIVGLLTRSIAITLDAVNNISDAASSIITIIGTKLASKDADKKHPFGYGRIEYFSTLVISLIVLYAGITSLQESIKSIMNPEKPTYGTVTLVILAIGIIVKVVLGRYFVSVGKKVDSGSLIGSGEDATLDSVISLATLVAAGIYMLTDLSLEAYLAAIISFVIIKAGLDMLRETISRLLGEKVDAELARELGKTIRSFPAVNGVYDLVLNDYGPDSYQGSVHIEVPDTYTANEVDQLIRNITVEVYKKHHIILSAIGVYSINTKDAHAMEMRKNISGMVLAHEHITQIHGFYLDEESKSIRFDLVVSFDAKDRQAVYQEVYEKVKEAYPAYRIEAVMDTDFISS